MNYTHRASSHLWGKDTYLFNKYDSRECMHETTGIFYKCYYGDWGHLWEKSDDVKIEEINFTLENE